jgi:hypothetical protein
MLPSKGHMELESLRRARWRFCFTNSPRNPGDHYGPSTQMALLIPIATFDPPGMMFNVLGQVVALAQNGGVNTAENAFHAYRSQLEITCLVWSHRRWIGLATKEP